MSILGNYKIINIIGEGSSSKVKLAQSITTGDFYALKIFKKSKLERNPRFLKQITREINILSHLNHPLIIRLHKILESNQKIYLVLDYINGGDLSQKLKSEEYFDEDTSRNYFQQIITAVSYMHSQNVIHRDLKLENILINLNTSQLTIIDFGLSILTKSSSQLLKTKCGTPYYAAPEIFGQSPYDGKPADIWGCGVILYIMLTGVFPFEGSTLQCVADEVTHAHVYYPSQFSEDLIDLFKHIFIINPKNRYTAEDIMKHPWFQNGYQAMKLNDLNNQTNNIRNNDLDVSSSSSDCKCFANANNISIDENGNLRIMNNTTQEIKISDCSSTASGQDQLASENVDTNQLRKLTGSSTFQSLAHHIDVNDTECNSEQNISDTLLIQPLDDTDDIPTAFEIIAKICQVDVGKFIKLCLKAKKDGLSCKEEYETDACCEHLLFSPQPFTSDDSNFIAFSTKKNKMKTFDIVNTFLDTFHANSKTENKDNFTFTACLPIQADVISLNIEIIPIDSRNVIIHAARNSGTPANFSRIVRAIKTRIEK